METSQHGCCSKSAAPGADSEYGYLDQEDFRRHYADPSHPNRVFFHVEGVHCTSCLWRIENLKNELPGIENIRLDMSRHIVEIEIAPGASLAVVAFKLKSMGYMPHPVAYPAIYADTKDGGHKSLLIKIGIAGAVAGNIMLLSTSLYSGAQHSEYGALFEWLTFVLFLPVLLYAAIPFYKNSWTALKNRRSSIDVPIVGAIVLGTGIGLYHLIGADGDVYFDSLAVLVFLLLSSRYLLFKIQNRFLAPSHLRAFYETNRVRFIDPETNKTEARHIDTINRNDTILVFEGERIPVDGVLVEGEAYLNAAVLTGEAEPQRVLENQEVFAGTQLTSDRAVVRVETVGRDTRVGQLLQETERGVLSRTPLISLTDRVAQWFSVSVLVFGVVFAVVYAILGDVQEAINRSLALVILACPCALALATPLTQSLALKKAAKKGCLIKKAEAFEKLCQIRRVFFDKTGTLTRGELELKSWWPGPPDYVERAIIHHLEKDSSHPIARLLFTQVSKRSIADIRLDHRKEVQGTGVMGYYDDDFYELRSIKDEKDLDGSGLIGEGGQSFAGLYRNGKLIKVACVGDRVRATSPAVAAAFRRRGKELYLITGDARNPALSVAAEVGIEPENVLYSKSPEEKKEILTGSSKSLMVGDGVNDSVALANAHVSVAVQGSMETSFRAADIYLTQPGLSPLVDLVELSHATIYIIKRNLLFSLVYNSVGGALALLGFINPLVAAVLMPISSVTVVLSSVIGNRFWRRFNNEPLLAERAQPVQQPLPTLASKGGGV